MIRYRRNYPVEEPGGKCDLLATGLGSCCRIQRAFPSDELRERALATNLVQRERKFDIVVLFYTLSFGFAAGSDRSLQVFLERYVEMVDCNQLSYAAFHDWFEPGFVALLREILDDAIENLDTGRTDLNGRLERFRDVLIADQPSFRCTKTPLMSTQQLARIKPN